MKILKDIQEARRTVLQRPDFSDDSARHTVEEILKDVREQGDSALTHYTRQLDGVALDRFEVTPEEWEEGKRSIDGALAEALRLAAQRVESFHKKALREGWVDEKSGLGQLRRPLDRVGLYIPGGRAAYPSTVLMTAIPARVAGVGQVLVCTPPGRDGKASPVVLAAARIAGVDRVFKIGGAQAIGAMAFGTESVPKVDKICGPGNIFVALAKRMVFGDVGVDGIQGPTETLIVADEEADTAFCARDLLAQAEHDPLASPLLITPSERLAQRVCSQVEQLLKGFNEGDAIVQSMKDRGAVILAKDMGECIDLANEYAPEHLCLLVKDPWRWVSAIRNSGGLFLGEYSPEVMGDYVAGPSHVMPTAGTARFSSALSTDDFQKTIALVALPQESLRDLGPTAVAIAKAEGLPAHARAVQERLDALARRAKREGS